VFIFGYLSVHDSGARSRLLKCSRLGVAGFRERWLFWCNELVVNVLGGVLVCVGVNGFWVLMGLTLFFSGAASSFRRFCLNELLDNPEELLTNTLFLVYSL